MYVRSSDGRGSSQMAKKTPCGGITKTRTEYVLHLSTFSYIRALIDWPND